MVKIISIEFNQFSWTCSCSHFCSHVIIDYVNVNTLHIFYKQLIESVNMLYGIIYNITEGPNIPPFEITLFDWMTKSLYLCPSWEEIAAIISGYQGTSAA